MARSKQLLKRILSRPWLRTVLVTLPIFVFLIYVLAAGTDGTQAYVYYAGVLYALAVTVICIGRIAAGILTLKGDDAFGTKFIHDDAFRTRIMLVIGTELNFIFIGIKLASGIYYDSMWFYSIAGYYTLLAVMRLILMRHVGSLSAVREWKQYRICGVMLLLMTLALTVIVVMIVRDNEGYDYHGILIYAMAAFVFYSVTAAVINLVRLRGHDSPALLAANAVSFVSAMMSILALETAMISRFSGDAHEFRRIMTAMSGGGVCVIVLSMAIYMISKSNRQLNKLKNNKNLQ